LIFATNISKVGNRHKIESMTPRMDRMRSRQVKIAEIRTQGF
jgi:hypothetical protein